MRIRTVDLTRKFRVGPSEIAAVNGISFEVDESKLTAIVGPSGSGKSTLLNLIGFNDYATSGRIFIDDMDASRLSGRKRRRIRLMHMGFVFQTFNLLPTLSALENVEMPMTLVGMSQKEQREKASKLLDAVGLGSRVSHRPKELSMGEMQRVAIARALANDPEVIVADEPTGELDSKTARETIALLSEINKKKRTTVIVATHDEKVVEVADKTYTIQDGRLKEGT
jgi:putative ABC transport system ATP-binding protein